MTTFNELNSNINNNQIKILKIIRKNPNVDFYKLSKKVKLNNIALQSELFDLWFIDFIQVSNHPHYESSTFSLDVMGERSAHAQMLSDVERFKEKCYGFCCGVATSVFVYFITTHLIK